MVKTDKSMLGFYLYEILKKYTDENHSLTYSEINKKLQLEFGLQADSKTLAKYVNLLMDNGFDIKKQGNNGCALLSRSMDNSERSFLIDAIFSSKSISSTQAKSLIQTLMQDCSIYERKKYDYVYKSDEIARTDNGEFFYTIDTITRAIEENKQISFTYNEVSLSKKLKTRFNGKEYVINPYFMVNNRGKYYLVCNYDKYNDLSHYKIDCISNIKILDTSIKPIQSLEGTKNFDIATYVNEHIYMFSGNTVEITIKIISPKVLNDIVDWYGDNIIIKEKDDGIYISFNVNERAFLYWALQYGLNIEVIKPEETRNRYIEMLKEILDKYKGE